MHPKRGQTFTGKLYSTFWNIWHLLIKSCSQPERLVLKILASGWLFLIFLFDMDYVVGQIKKPPSKISSWPGPSSWCYRIYQADPVNSAQRETASSCQSISTHRASPAIAKRNSNHPRSHFFIPGNCWSIVITQRCSHVQNAWKSVAMQNIFLQRKKLTLLAC